jgi:propanol-preferring alcohol dehydrogenase
MIIPEASAYRVPENIDDAHAAPLLCAGAVGHRSLRLAHITDGDILGFMGFGASAHLLLQTVRQTLPAVKCFVFARSRNQREFARDLGAAWTGTIEESPPEPLNAIIDTTPVWKPVIESMAKLAPGGRLVINAIRKIDADKRYLLNTTYHDHLWLEKEIKTTANVTRKDISEFLNLAGQITINVEVQTYALEKANEALSDLHKGSGKGARVLVIE